MDELLEGYRRFRAESWPARRALFERLAREGQRPVALVIACSDSRTDPGMVFDAGPGEIFTIRNVAALVPPYERDDAFHGTSAAIEFAVTVLEVPQVIVLGHAMCGGIRALLAEHGPASAGDFIGGWLRIAAPARARALECSSPEQAQERGEQEGVKLSLANLLTFPWVAERVADGRMRLHGASFDIRTGVLTRLQEDGSFAPA
jgi:carbonic anhydrase